MRDRGGPVVHPESGPAGAGPASRGVLEGAFRLLDALRDAGEVGLSQLVRQTGLPKASVHRLLRQLCELGAVEQRDGVYCVGPHLYWLGQSWRPDTALMEATRGPVQRLAQATGASIGVGVRAHGQVSLVRGVPGEVASQAPMGPGLAWPSCTAAARVLLAWDASPRLEWKSAMSPEEGERIRRSRAAFDREEIVPGVACVAVPIMHPSRDDPIAVLAAIVGPAQPFGRLTALLHRASESITSAMPALRREI